VITAKGWWAQQQTVKADAIRWPNRDDNYHSWPIRVTFTEEHVIWVAAETPQEALDYACRDTHERLDRGSTCVSADLSVAAPVSRWDWEMVYEESGHSYGGLRYDAHVQARDEWLRSIEQARLEATMHHEEREQVPAGQRATCAVCRCWREEYGHEQSEQHLREAIWAARRAAVWAQDVDNIGRTS